MLNYVVILRKSHPPLCASVCAGLLLQAFCLVACSGNGSGDTHYRPSFVSTTKNKHELILGMPALAYYETTDLIVRYLNTRLDSFTIRTVACTSIEDYEKKLKQGYFDFTVINGPQLLTAEQSGYRIVGRIAGDYRTILVVNKDSGINEYSDCNGKSIALTSNRVLAGSVMPLLFLHDHGVDVNHHLRRLYCPSYESILLNVCLGKCAIGGVWESIYANFQSKNPGLASHVQVKWTTPALANSGLLFRHNIDSNASKKLASLLFGLQSNEEGRKALQRIGIGPFTTADSTTYFPMKAVLRKYDSLIH